MSEHNKRRIGFLGTVIHLSFLPRTDKCARCGRVKDGINIRRTCRHHWFYLPIMRWACTEELCNSCHKSNHGPYRGKRKKYRRNIFRFECYYCGKKESIEQKTTWQHWYHNHDRDNNVLCKRCYLYIRRLSMKPI